MKILPPRKKKPRGFAILKANDPDRLREISAMAGSLAHAQGKAHEYDAASAAAAGKIGGAVVGEDRFWMMELGRRGRRVREENKQPIGRFEELDESDLEMSFDEVVDSEESKP